MSSDRLPRRAVLLALIGLGGCGFAPIYGDGGGLRGQISFDSNDSVAGFRLREQLELRFGVAGAGAPYRLRATVRTRERAAAIDADGDTTRLNIVGSAEWVLSDSTTGRRIEDGTVEAFTGYSAAASTVATQSTRDDALNRLAIILADLIASRLLALTQDLAP